MRGGDCGGEGVRIMFRPSISAPRSIALPVALAAVALLAGCAESSKLPKGADTGPDPQLTAPNKSLIPTLHIATAAGWSAPGAKPIAAAGTRVQAFASGLDHPRWIYVLPNGDVLVAESNAPPREGDNTNPGIKGWVMKKAQKRAGAGEPSPNRIMLLRDADGDGVAETRTVFLSKLYSPFGMALVGNDLYVANADAVVHFPYTPGATSITTPGTKVVELPGGPINHHWTKNIIASPDGRKLYATVGSNSNIGDNGMGNEQGR